MDSMFRAYSDRINHAFAYGSVHPEGHLRKGTRVSYVTHLANVALILSRYGRDEDTIVAGVLHDVVEDCDAHGRDHHERQIGDKFGPEVLRIVLDVTHSTHDDAGIPLTSEGKKRVYLQHLASASDRARWVSAADKLHNARSILGDLTRASDTDDVWGRFNVGRDATVQWYRRVYDRLLKTGFSGAILPELLDAVECLEAVSRILEFKRDPTGKRSAEFWHWIQTHPRDYFINITSQGNGMIHYGDCEHMSFAEPSTVNFLSAEKWCAEDRDELEKFASDRQTALTECSDCFHLTRSKHVAI